MKLTYGSKVYSSDEKELGFIQELVIDPRSRAVTHIVVQQGLFFSSDRLIGVDVIADAREGEVILKETAAKLDEELSADYRADEYVPLADDAIRQHLGGTGRAWVRPPHAAISDVPYPSIVPPGIAALPTDPQVIVSLDEIALEQGALVRTKDGKRIGSVDQCITDEDDNLTHILIRKGTFFPVPKLVPIDWVARIEENEIVLAVNAESLKNLPESSPDS